MRSRTIGTLEHLPPRSCWFIYEFSLGRFDVGNRKERSISREQAKRLGSLAIIRWAPLLTGMSSFIAPSQKYLNGTSLPLGKNRDFTVPRSPFVLSSSYYLIGFFFSRLSGLAHRAYLISVSQLCQLDCWSWLGWSRSDQIKAAAFCCFTNSSPTFGDLEERYGDSFVPTYWPAKSQEVESNQKVNEKKQPQFKSLVDLNK